MSTLSKEKVINKLRELINSTDFKSIEKSKPKLATIIKNIKADDLIFGETMTARIFIGHFTGNVRSDGSKSNDDYRQTRTINFDFTTKSIGFIDSENTADDDALYYAAQLLGMHMYNLGAAKFSHFEQLGKEIYKQDESNFALIRNVFPRCEYEHDKLGFYLDSSSIKILQAEFSKENEAEIPICAVYANYLDKKGKQNQILLGYYAGNDTIEQEEIIINSETLNGKSKKKSGVPDGKKISLGKIIKWIILSFIAIDIIGVIISVLSTR